jgi:hypothetical protein
VRDREIVVTIRRGTLLQRPRGRKKRSCDLSRKRKLANLRIEAKDYTFFQKEKYGRIIKTANENERSEIL